MNDRELLELLLAMPNEPEQLHALVAHEPFRSRRCYRGKVRDCYVDDSKHTRILVATDRLSAFDRILCAIPAKGQVLNRLSNFWFEKTAQAVPNHVLAAPDPQVTIAMDLTPIPVEFVVRGYLAGVTSTSIWQAYRRGERNYAGHVLPDGLAQFDPLPQPLVTPSTKAPAGQHDVTTSREALLESGVIDAATYDAAAAIALKLFALGTAHAADRGLILADTKYEFGIDASGTIRIMDELHTPDSSRYWQADSYRQCRISGAQPESLDKEFVRAHLVDAYGFRGDGPVPPLELSFRAEVARRYIRGYEQLTGLEFIPDPAPPVARIVAACAHLAAAQSQY